MSELDRLETEKRNPRTMDIDELDSFEVVKRINEEDALVPGAVAAALPQIARAVDQIVEAIKKRGRLIYIGAGTSGRIGILDALECPPTFGTPPQLVQGIIAGGAGAVDTSWETAEDQYDLGKNDLQEIRLTDRDIVVGIAASGRTPYVIGALQYANEVGATSVALVCNPGTKMEQVAKHTICVVTGPEVVTGSTRMKAGTAQKMVLNMLSTATMIRLGKVYQNLMVDVEPLNHKLIERSKNIVIEATGCTRAEAEKALSEQNGNTKAAILQLLTDLSPDEAVRLLELHDGVLKKALAAVNKN
ncbi:N-acetylmuramic acid 6-phosphate etherase [Thermoactinomyces sp. CICC 10522]|uniref:N-acetylmuramic acid 6-phosphate etherase n=1 Tax=Thermoactinomyces sp. CICC 10522 TaxID=2767427 RepID=UPI0018DC1A36|nr:N-acetylmuramic acid 6-phosphate etherase [Thermoactinomyces sp. CICC 10522]MBH8605891.1 N-acetylmuramic acid 6-phosphate etherase [Thermoactinomyces sp. CICC 10522]